MNVFRGQVVLIDFPFAGGSGSKVRPALVVQNDRDNHRLTNTIVAMISSRVTRQTESTQVFIELSSSGGQTGLRVDSVVNCVNLFTIERSKVLRQLGMMPPTLMATVDNAIRAALGLP